MIIKLVKDPSNSDARNEVVFIEADKIHVERLDDGNIDLEIQLNGDVKRCCTVGNHVNEQGKDISSPSYSIAYIMEMGKTVEVLTWKQP